MSTADDCISPTFSSFTAIARIMGSPMPPVIGLVAFATIAPGSVTEYDHTRQRALLALTAGAAARAARVRTDDPGGTVSVRYQEVHPLERVAECTRLWRDSPDLDLQRGREIFSSAPTPSWEGADIVTIVRVRALRTRR